MEKCPAIVNISFDDESLNGIEKIKEMHELEKYGRIWLTIGNLFSIFGGSSLRSTTAGHAKEVFKLISNDTLKVTAKAVAKGVASEANQTSYSITQANWEYYFQSYINLTTIKRKKIEELAYSQALKHQSSPKEYMFWKSIYMGCKI
ncbi:hypothetical protein [Photobacterium alginatilyticum]|uniref:Uncharacterized protein n=1 Tax=Photobacterium alginatilyticum TaxID=1775171 RepID=A0ABW9YQZ4_9GAMM|nr:hypothetical protein [Photobacterium alginatilyticum]NBI56281.1 hypothetical protein [Photobacterium alginatilyticum]